MGPCKQTAPKHIVIVIIVKLARSLARQAENEWKASGLMTAAATAALLAGRMFVRRLIYTFSNGARFTATKRPKRTLLNAPNML